MLVGNLFAGLSEWERVETLSESVESGNVTFSYDKRLSCWA